MRKIFTILLLIAGCIPCPAQYPVWSDFYMAKIGSYYSLNVYRTPIRAWLSPDTTRLFLLKHNAINKYFPADSVLLGSRPDTFDILTGKILWLDSLKFVDGVTMSSSMGISLRISGTEFSIGTNAGDANYCNFFGEYAGNDAVYAIHSNFFGRYAGYTATDAIHSNFFGNAAGYTATNAKHSNFFGQGAGYGATNDSFSIAMGRSSSQNATGHHIASFGDSSGYAEDNSHVFVCGKNANATRDSQFYIGGDIKELVMGFAGSKFLVDTLKLTTVYKKAFGNAVANLRDTILCAGVKADSTICNPAYIYDSGATTFNALMYYVKPDTIFTIRQAATDPDTFSLMVVKKK